MDDTNTQAMGGGVGGIDQAERAREKERGHVAEAATDAETDRVRGGEIGMGLTDRVRGGGSGMGLTERGTGHGAGRGARAL